MAESLDAFLGRTTPKPTTGRDLSFDEFLKGDLPKSEPPELIAIPPVQQETVATDESYIVPLIGDWESFSDRAGDLADANETGVIDLLTDNPQAFSLNSRNRNETVLTTARVEGGGADGDLYYQVCTELQAPDYTTIPNFSAIVRANKLSEFFALFGVDERLMRSYLEIVSPQAPELINGIIDTVERYTARQFHIEELHPSYRRELPVPDYTLTITETPVSYAIRLSGRAIDADWIAIVGEIPHRLPVKERGVFDGLLLRGSNLSSGLMMYALNSQTRERSEAVQLLFTPPVIAEPAAKYFELAGLLDRVRPGWNSDIRLRVPAARIMSQAAMELLDSQTRSEIGRMVNADGSARMFTGTQDILLSNRR